MNPIVPDRLAGAPALRNGRTAAQAAAGAAPHPSPAVPPGLSVVIPVYNSAEILPLLLPRLQAVLAALTARHEIILVNDGSRDHSWQVAAGWAQQHHEIVAIDLMRNYGQHNALLCGIRAARYEVIITMDDDLQHPPEEIPKLLARLQEGYDVVYGTPAKESHSVLRNLLSRLTKTTISSTLGNHQIRDISAFRAIRAEVCRAFADYASPYVLLDLLLSWGTGKFACVVVSHRVRQAGKSNYTFWKLFNQAMLILTGFSTAPLRLASLVGFGFTLFGIVVFLYVIVGFFVRGSIPGFPFLASIISLFSGAQLFALGIIGEYLARMFTRSIQKPTYVVKQVAKAERHTSAAVSAGEEPRHG
ncbi:MAG: glycosyltransferase family 2 protein [candidate division KSB1 bacterium]|nr:glycosyltransferase family 2 protein [candidate division KSB1 bacterium]MDZ7276115.1 glycosyltransferase family 2 protein [candidate division KSB1 bacterium]MDZ7287105.1 glycosyltransferase family 2 protein [candidate division KSB1 bacterium]MDZ7296970.1 glycosyltransferase family 2 protein [candidate division KSB1 bacterium]MDZ7306201.1 glycosyltransferase family 2 protein [candidate division KSB1 bacterium]